MAIANKNEIEIFYKTHSLSIKEVATHFNISYRTLAHWVKSEKWVAGSAVECAQKEVSVSVVQDSIDNVLDVTRSRLKMAIKNDLGEVANKIDSLVLENLLESSTDEILARAMSLNFIQKNIALSAVIAKDRLLRLAQNTQGDTRADPTIIACAEKVVSIFDKMQSAIYGRTPLSVSQEKEVKDMSLQELNALLKELDN